LQYDEHHISTEVWQHQADKSSVAGPLRTGGVGDRILPASAHGFAGPFEPEVPEIGFAMLTSEVSDRELRLGSRVVLIR
jgi:hypothetical protein